MKEQDELPESLGEMKGAFVGSLVRNNVYHIHVNHGRKCDPQWKELLGDNLLETSEPNAVARLISDVILASASTMISKQENLL